MTWPLIDVLMLRKDIYSHTVTLIQRLDFGEGFSATRAHSSVFSSLCLSFDAIGCSIRALVAGVLLAVAIGVAMGVVIGGIMLCLLTMYMKR